ncbi:NAD(P)-dependent oxidoreductase [Phenylobacterium sp. LjRoot219]|uniref:NAD(P)-dependent oxidoreductase n=1 Tax=Phenylobacterium sp. LjRoot219 TaxID=3342283 RepID=UPI003ECFD84B
MDQVKSNKPVCGFIGLGSQGAPIARRMLDAGLPVVLWARRPETLEPFRGSSARIVDSVAELAAAAEHVGLCVLDDAAVLEVCDQLIPAMRPGGRIVIHSTTLPQTCRRVARAAQASGLAVLEAPVSGGAPAAQAGVLTLMTAGTPDVLEQARPVLETFSARILHLGDYGAAQAAKLLNNSLLGANMAMAHQALMAAEDLGLERASFLELLQASSGRSFGLEVLARQPSLEAFANGPALAEKVRLLGEAVGHASPEVDVLARAVASAFGR